MVKSALAETPLGPMASSIPSFGAEAASGPAHMNPVSISPTLSSQFDVMYVAIIFSRYRFIIKGGSDDCHLDKPEGEAGRRTWWTRG